ncbi:MAG: 23S rRNA (guanosine(2251)-2'-O)-methyltransferase RlmB [Alphaproteobacteria bacterium]|nr:23S rRNA (guanosine(2251)-2'-O)-methyltransferase RlmB [Alphaproteobacteria bacterium]MBV8548937.1 23S rRNA (guanosine(2251)-2'-O)-methyltransferase RlmB [Alphaproteobacteria bacterium]
MKHKSSSGRGRFAQRAAKADSKPYGRRQDAREGKKAEPQHRGDKRPARHGDKAATGGYEGRRFAGGDRKAQQASHNTKTKPARSVRPEPRHEARREEPRRVEGNLIWGLHAVRAAWLNPARRCHRLWLTEAGRTSMEQTMADGREALLKRPDAKLVDRQELDRLTPPGTVHQGIVMEANALHEPMLSELIAGDTPPDALLMLDQVTDPHNVGAILRSAAAFGAGGVIMTERNAPGTTGVLAKTASGALEHVPQVHVVNLARAMDELQQAGYWCVGLAEEGERDLAELDLTGRTVLVMGAEGDGLRQLTRKKCDELARLPTGGEIGSLNVSNAAAVALYEWKRQKTRK